MKADSELCIGPDGEQVGHPIAWREGSYGDGGFIMDIDVISKEEAPSYSGLLDRFDMVFFFCPHCGRKFEFRE